VRERQVGFVFQHYALFRHMTVFDNVAFGLNVRPRSSRPAKWEISDRVHGLLSWSSWRTLPDVTRLSFPAVRDSGWPWPGPWRWSRRCLLLDEPFGLWTPGQG